MRNDARPIGETAQRDRDPSRQEQTIDRSPHDAASPAPEPTGEEEKAGERTDREQTMPTNDSTLRTKI